jgi:hypothetical protein
MHRRVLDELEALYSDDPGPHLAELAHHAIAARDGERAVHYATRAADHALASLADEEAARQYETALAALDPADEAARCRLLLSLGEAESRAGNGAAARTALLAAAGIARRVGLAPELARAAVGYGGRMAWVRAGADDRLLPLLEEGLLALGDEDDELRVALLGRLAGALRGDQRARSDELSREALALARRTGRPAALEYALEGRAYAILAPDAMTEILALGSELRDVAARSGNSERVIGGHMLRIMALLQAGDLAGAAADLDAAGAVAAELRQPERLWQADSARAMLALATGRLDDAEALMERAFSHGERAQPAAAIPVVQLQRYTLRELRGGVATLEPAVRQVVAEHPARPVFRCVLAQLCARAGREAEAAAILAELAADDFAALPFEQEWLFAMAMLAEAAARLGDRTAAAPLYHRLLPFAACNAADLPEGMRGSVSRHLGLLAWTLGHVDDAEAHFEAALAMNERMGAEPWLARTREEFARMLEARAGLGDAARGRELAAAAAAAERIYRRSPVS